MSRPWNPNITKKIFRKQLGKIRESIIQTLGKKGINDPNLRFFFNIEHIKPPRTPEDVRALSNKQLLKLFKRNNIPQVLTFIDTYKRETQISMRQIDDERHQLNLLYRNLDYYMSEQDFIRQNNNFKIARDKLWNNIMDINTIRNIFANELPLLFAEIRDRQTLIETKNGWEAEDKYEINPPLRIQLEDKIIEIIDLLQKIGEENFEDNLSRLAGKKRKTRRKKYKKRHRKIYKKTHRK